MAYGRSGLGGRITRIAEQVGGAAVNGGVTNWLGVQAAAKSILASQGNAKPTAQQLAQAENQVLAVNEPAMTSTYVPAGAAALWLLGEGIDAFSSRGMPAAAAVGQGIGIPAARDLAEHVTALVRRKLRKVTVASPAGFAGQVRDRGRLAPPASPAAQQIPAYTSRSAGDLTEPV